MGINEAEGGLCGPGEQGGLSGDVGPAFDDHVWMRKMMKDPGLTKFEAKSILALGGTGFHWTLSKARMAFEYSRKIHVYISGPYSSYPPYGTAEALRWANVIESQHFHCHIPHLSMFWDMAHPHEYPFWIDRDFEELSRNDALVRIPGDSPGADGEFIKAEEWGLVTVADAQTPEEAKASLERIYEI